MCRSHYKSRVTVQLYNDVQCDNLCAPHSMLVFVGRTYQVSQKQHVESVLCLFGTTTYTHWSHTAELASWPRQCREEPFFKSLDFKWGSRVSVWDGRLSSDKADSPPLGFCCPEQHVASEMVPQRHLALLRVVLILGLFRFMHE